jgi:hypothetical protein
MHAQPTVPYKYMYDLSLTTQVDQNDVGTVYIWGKNPVAIFIGF